MNTPLPIAIDAMGGDEAPASVIEGAMLAHRRYPEQHFLFFGDEKELLPLLKKYRMRGLRAFSEIVHTDERVSGDAIPSQALRQGKRSSMRLAIDAVADGRAGAVVSAGNTGALMAMSKVVYKTLPGIYRPAICTSFPTLRGDSVLLDLGANIESTADDLFQYAIMGAAFARAALGLVNPKVGLLNVGSEDIKGHEHLREAHQTLRDKEKDIGMNFCGFVEGHEIAEGKVDVVVTDGFTGNVALKTAEGTAFMIRSFIREAFMSSFSAKIAWVISRSAISRLKKKLDPRKYNGAMFIGLNGITIKSHGRSDGYAFYHAIKVAIELAGHQVNDRIIEEIRLSGIAQASGNGKTGNGKNGESNETDNVKTPA